MKLDIKSFAKRFSRPQQLDLWLVFLWSVFVWVMVDYLDFFEWLYEFSRDHEDQNIDEIFSVLIFMPIALLMVTFRRQHALEAEIELRQKAEEKIRHLAFYDPLTGLLNRNALEDRLSIALARAKRFDSELALMYIDLDGFKDVNDHYGHDAGDEVLRLVAQDIQNSVRDIDSVIRIGGDEFCLVLSEAGPKDQLAKVAGRLIANIGRSKHVSGHTVQVGASIGIARLSTHLDQAEESLLREADSAMYEAKRAGKNRFCFFEQSVAASSTSL